jgi:hypothetical protein
MTSVGFEPTVSVSERAKTARLLWPSPSDDYPPGMRGILTGIWEIRVIFRNVCVCVWVRERAVMMHCGLECFASQADLSLNRARGILCLSWMGLYWPNCFIWGLSLIWLLRYDVVAVAGTWLWIVFIPVCSCNVSVGITPGSFITIRNTMF